MPLVPPDRPTPQEIPYREVPHIHPESDPTIRMPDFWPSFVGYVGEEFWHGDGKDAKEWEKDLLRRKAARAQLGGFGFQR